MARVKPVRKRGNGLVVSDPEDRPVCRVRKSGDQSISHGTWTSVTWQVTDYDPKGMHSPNVNPSRITIAKPGIYLVNAQTGWAGGGSSGARVASISINGTRTTRTVNVTDFGGAHDVSGVFELSAGDYVELEVFQNSGSALDFVHGGGSGVTPYMAVTQLVGATS